MTPDCDLLSDYRARQDGLPADDERVRAKLLPNILLCDVFEEAEIHIRAAGSATWKRVQQNQDERYHHLLEAPIRGRYVDAFFGGLPNLYLDFKKILTLPTNLLYEALADSRVGRVAVVPSLWLQDLVHRFYSFQGRVGPE